MTATPETTAPPAHLPLSTSSTLQLVHPTAAEKDATWRINGATWRGALSIESYLRREHYLAAQPLTQNGGITYWILVDSAESPASADPESKLPLPFHQHISTRRCARPLQRRIAQLTTLFPVGPPTRTILSSCESLRKRALVAHRASAPTVSAITAHGIGSVFCAPVLRKRGYAGRMMAELNRALATHQQADGQKSLFNVLYSDIGKQFYARRGWHARESRHVALPAVPEAGEEKGTTARALYAADLRALCEADERLLRRKMGRWGEGGPDTRVAFVPDVETVGWHHAREEFAAEEMLGRRPEVKGAVVETAEGRVWAVWTRTFGASEEGNLLHVLRMVVEGALEEKEEGTWSVEAAAEVLRAAQREAGRWAMKTVEVWNPEGVVVLAARSIVGEVEVVDRDEESITSLMWYGEGEVEWVGNEKYGWC
ncbi:hypothetical protein MMC26_002245 [Xylographa opegraphella]|nr:hypothetical protein [Xylographa opegraphella]